MKKRITALITAAAAAVSATALLPSAAVLSSTETTGTGTAARQMEYLDRGTVAVKVSGGVYLSWRLLGTENYDTAFDVYKGSTRITTVSDSTNFTDTAGSAGDTYTVVKKDAPVSSGKSVKVWGTNYMSIPIEAPSYSCEFQGQSYNFTYSANDASCADLDGDGEYEIILKWDPSGSFDSGSAHSGPSGNVFIDAYKLDGTRLWRMDLGVNISAGAHFTQIAAYDFDLDGKGEIAFKTAPGSKDGTGAYVSEASSVAAIKNTTQNGTDYRNGEGRVTTGDEYYTVFDGITGKALDTVYYPHPIGNNVSWGSDSHGKPDYTWNRAHRYLTTTAYLDGVTPSIIAWRGYYDKTTVTAYNLVNKKLVQIADFDTDTYAGVNAEHAAGQGNHNTTVGDVDGDGRDEVLCGGLCLELENDDFSVKWSTNTGHGDALHLADYDPTHDGMEYFIVHEHAPYGMSLVYPETGEIVFHKDAGGDTGRGIMVNCKNEGYYQIWGVGTAYKDAEGFKGYNAAGGLSTKSANFRIFWDGDLYDEMWDAASTSQLNTIAIDKGSGRLMSIGDIKLNNYTKANACLQADLLGDWREELVLRNDASTELRIYTTTYPTAEKLYTLMHDSAYRMQVVGQNSAYNQPPHIGYYVSPNKDENDMREKAAYIKTVYDGTESIRNGNTPNSTPEPTPETITVNADADTYLVYTTTASAHGSDPELKINPGGK